MKVFYRVRALNALHTGPKPIQIAERSDMVALNAATNSKEPTGLDMTKEVYTTRSSCCFQIEVRCGFGVASSQVGSSVLENHALTEAWSSDGKDLLKRRSQRFWSRVLRDYCIISTDAMNVRGQGQLSYCAPSCFGNVRLVKQKRLAGKVGKSETQSDYVALRGSRDGARGEEMAKAGKIAHAFDN
ncbi:MAG TPA: hypothetical protein VKE24_12345 [Candidatus Acidoferrales bacterium]|nr:hypothetical protein [Candidatus Acidoferrales bacterium]